MTYASPAFFYALPLYLKKDLENVEKQALSIICPGLAYRKALELSNIMSINDYIASLASQLAPMFPPPQTKIIYSRLKQALISTNEALNMCHTCNVQKCANSKCKHLHENYCPRGEDHNDYNSLFYRLKLLKVYQACCCRP